jgi:PHD/YefM family antitoxin component YafN of YafNO toxin-antitoxin module
MPGLKNKLDNIFASIINDRTVKIKTNGGSFIQMSNFGLSKDEANNEYDGIKWSPIVDNGETTRPYTLKRDVNGEIVTNIFGDAVIVPEEVLISGSFIAKYIPNYEDFSSEQLFGTMNSETGELEGGIIDKKILDTIIGYRIPNQGPSSNGAMKIVGILPPGVGDTIVAFTGITKKTGSDFDIDKMYIMFPNYKEVDGKLKYTDSTDGSKEANQNKVIELYKTLILHKDNITKIMTPLDFEHIKMEAQNLAPAKTKSDLDNYEFVQDIVTKYSFLAGLAGVGQEANTSSDYAMGTMSNVYLEDVNLGKRSHQGEEFETTVMARDGQTYQTLIPLTKFDKIDSVDISDSELKGWLDSYNKRVSDPKKKLTFEGVKSYKSFAISDNISALMNAFVDIAKDPYITNVNWSMMTTNTGNMMLRAGVHPFIVMSFLAQPIINEYIEFTSQYETRDKANQVSNSKDAFRIYKVGELIKDDLIPVSKFENGDVAEINSRSLYNIVTLYNFSLNNLGENDFTAPKNLEKIKEAVGLPKEHKFTDLDISQLKESIKPIIKNHNIFFTENFKDYVIDTELSVLREHVFKYDTKFQAKTFNTFLEFQGFSKKLKSSVDASRHGVNGMGKNTTQLLIAQNRILNIEQKGIINYDTKMYYEDGTPKFLAHLKVNNLDRTQKIVENNPLLFVSSSPFVWNSYNKVSQNIYGINLEDDAQDGLGDKLDRIFNTYLMSGFEPFNLSNSEKSDIVENFPNKFIEFKNKYAGKYKIIDELNIKKTESRTYITLDNKTNSKEYTDSMINSWRDLIKYYPEIGTDLIKYSFLTSGFNNNVVSFFQFIPSSFFFQNDFNTYIKSFVNYPGVVDNNFIDHFYLSNLEDSQIVKFVNKSMKMKGQPYLKDGLTLFNANVTKDYINVNSEYYKRVGTREVKGETENIYTKYIKVEGGYAIIAPIVSERDKGISINNYNSNRVSLTPDLTLTSETINALNTAISEIKNDNEMVTQTDEFGQEEVVVKEPLTEFETVETVETIDESKSFSKILMEVRDELKSFNKVSEIKVTKTDLLKSLFRKDNTSGVAKGSVVNYNDKKWIVWGISDNGRAKLIDTEGNKFSGTPSLDKLSKIGDYTTTVFNGTDYIVTQNENIYSLDTGKQVFNSLDDSTKSKKAKIIEQIMTENDLMLDMSNLTEEEIKTIKDQQENC